MGGLNFKKCLQFAKDFRVVPEIMSTSKLRTVFEDVNIMSKRRDDVANVLSEDEFISLQAHTGIRYGGGEFGEGTKPSARLKEYLRHLQNMWLMHRKPRGLQAAVSF